MKIDVGDNPEDAYYYVKLYAFDVSPQCVAADDEEGWVELLIYSEEYGCYIADYNLQPVTARIYGDVTIDLAPSHPDYEGEDA